MSAPPPFVHTAQRSAERAMRSSAEKRCAACSHRRDAQRIRLPSSSFSVVSLLAAVQSADGPRVRALLHLAQPAPADNDTTAAAAAAVAPAPSSLPIRMCATPTARVVCRCWWSKRQCAATAAHGASTSVHDGDDDDDDKDGSSAAAEGARGVWRACSARRCS